MAFFLYLVPNINVSGLETNISAVYKNDSINHVLVIRPDDEPSDVQ